MIATIKAEFLKLFTVRSTYIVSLLALLLVGFFAFYIEGYRGISESGGITAYKQIVLSATGLAAQFIAIAAILFSVHEYRHNTITYTLTSSNSRTKVLLAKILVVTSYAAFIGAVAGLLGLACYQLGLGLREVSVQPATSDVLYAFGRGLFYCVGYALLGTLLAFLSRNIALAIGVLFMADATIEPLLGLLLKSNAVYLPFTALSQVLIEPGQQRLVQGSLSPGKAMLLSLIYLAVGWCITWWLFLRRDAT